MRITIFVMTQRGVVLALFALGLCNLSSGGSYSLTGDLRQAGMRFLGVLILALSTMASGKLAAPTIAGNRYYAHPQVLVRILK